MKKNDGGTAFPDQGQRINEDGKWAQDYCPGMTLRDYFAVHALEWATGSEWFSKEPEHIAQRAYNMADAMLAEREKED